MVALKVLGLFLSASAASAFALPTVAGPQALPNGRSAAWVKPATVAGGPSAALTRLQASGAANLRGGGGGAGLWDAYNAQLAARPIFTKCWTCFLIAALGDVICQRITPGFTALDAKRIAVFGAAQFLYFGPVMHYWFGIVDKISRLPYFAQPSTPKWQLVLAQTLFDQTVGTVLVISGFFVFFGFINAAADGALLSVGVPALLAQGVAKVGADLWPTMLANWKIWPAANALSFAVVPLQYRVLFSNMVAVVWNIYLSGVIRK